MNSLDSGKGSALAVADSFYLLANEGGLVKGKPITMGGKLKTTPCPTCGKPVGRAGCQACANGDKATLGVCVVCGHGVTTEGQDNVPCGAIIHEGCTPRHVHGCTECSKALGYADQDPDLQAQRDATTDYASMSRRELAQIKGNYYANGQHYPGLLEAIEAAEEEAQASHSHVVVRGADDRLVWDVDERLSEEEFGAALADAIEQAGEWAAKQNPWLGAWREQGDDMPCPNCGERGIETQDGISACHACGWEKNNPLAEDEE